MGLPVIVNWFNVLAVLIHICFAAGETGCLSEIYPNQKYIYNMIYLSTDRNLNEL